MSSDIPKLLQLQNSSLLRSQVSSSVRCDEPKSLMEYLKLDTSLWSNREIPNRPQCQVHKFIIFRYIQINEYCIQSNGSRVNI